MPRARQLRLIVLTGGPGAGKTAVLHAARLESCRHVAALPEAASILFGGGFPRHETMAGRRAAQRAIFHVQRESERLVEDEHIAHAALCDRGTIDGEAYWPGDARAYWEAVNASRDEELARYALVVHMRTPESSDWYLRDSGLRTESALVAREIDERIMAAWDGHPNRIVVASSSRFDRKLQQALEAIRPWLAAEAPTAPDAASDHGIYT